MRAKEFLFESIINEALLTPQELFNTNNERHLWRPAAFLEKLKGGTPFVDNAGNEYYPDDGEFERLTPIVNNILNKLKKDLNYVKTAKPEITINMKDHGPVNIRQLKKDDLAKKGMVGQSSGPGVQPIDIGIATTPRAKLKGKSKEKITTDQSIKDALDQHKEIPAGKLYSVIMSNQQLDQAGELGKAIKQAASEINEGKNPAVGQYAEKIQKKIAIDAGEYLGILAMVNDVCTWTNDKKTGFLKFLKEQNLDNLALIFPGEQNASLADSYGVQNAKTGHTIMISSKGGKGKTATGAAPALSGLQTSVDKRVKEIKPGNGLDFINTLNKTPVVKQGFVGLNWIAEHYPNKLPKQYQKLVPFSDSDIDAILENWRTNGQSKLPAKYKPLISSPSMLKSKATPGGKVIYVTVKDVINTMNSGIIPGFRETVLELLDENFMQIFTRIVGGKLVFEVLWPGKIDGNVQLYSKIAAPEPNKQAMSFKVF
jgi:hypothetical protein